MYILIFFPSRLLFQMFWTKKTYGHKYYVAASIGFEEKSYLFIRKMNSCAKPARHQVQLHHQ